MTIRLTIRLFGTLSSKVLDYDHEKGLRVDVPDDVTPEALLKDLKIPLSHIGLISNGSQSIKLGTPLTDKMSISFFSLISGG